MPLALLSRQNCKIRTFFASRRRHRHADSLRHLTVDAFCPATNSKLVAVFLYVGLFQHLQIQLLAQGKKTADDMLADCRLRLWEGTSAKKGIVKHSDFKLENRGVVIFCVRNCQLPIVNY